MLLNGGTMFKPNACISYYTVFNTEEEVDAIWNKMLPSGKVLMPLNEYPWNKKYGWISDKYGVSWQLTVEKKEEKGKKFIPTLMFTGENFGKAEEAINFYTSIFTDSNIHFISRYDSSDKLQGGKLNHGRFQLLGKDFVIMDTALKHDFNFTEGNSFVINCENQEEIDKYWNSLAYNEQQCGWLRDKYGVSWQIVPANMGTLMANNPKGIENLMKMKKIEIAALKG